MSLYDELQPVVTGLLSEFGQGSVSYIRVVPGNGPADDPGASVSTPFPVNAAVRGVQFRYVQNGLAAASDLQLTMNVSPDFVPDLRGFVEIDGVRYKIVQILPKPAAGTPVAYVLIVRK